MIDRDVYIIKDRRKNVSIPPLRMHMHAMKATLTKGEKSAKQVKSEQLGK